MNKELMVIKDIFESGKEVSAISFALFGLSTMDTFSIIEDISDQIVIDEIKQRNETILLYKLNNKILAQGVKQKNNKVLGVAITEKFDTLVKGNKVIASRSSGFSLRVADDKIWHSHNASNFLTFDSIDGIHNRLLEIKEEQ